MHDEATVIVDGMMYDTQVSDLMLLLGMAASDLDAVKMNLIWASSNITHH